MNKLWWRLLPLIGLILFLYIIFTIDLGQFWNSLSAFKLVYLLLAPLYLLIALPLKGIKWKLLLNACKQDLPFWASIKIWTIGFFASLITPGKAGDLIRAFYVKKYNKLGFAHSLTSIVLERIIDIVTLLILTVFSVILLTDRYHYEISLFNTILIVAIIVIIFYVTTKRKWMVPVVKRSLVIIPRKYRKVILRSVKNLYSSIELVKHDSPRLVIITLITFALWFILFYYMKLMSDGLGLYLSLDFVFMLLPIITFIELVPISISGLGTREAAMVAFFSLISLNASQAVSYSIVYLLMGSWMVGLIGFFFWIRNPIPISIDLKSIRDE